MTTVVHPQTRTSLASASVLARRRPARAKAAAAGLPVTGQLPADLHGDFLRRGNGPHDRLRHWCRTPTPGAQILHGLRLHEGVAQWYRQPEPTVPGADRPAVAEPVLCPSRAAGHAHATGHGSLPHPGYDSATGKLHSLVQYGDLPVLEHVASTGGTVRVLGPVRLPGMPLLHAVSVTAQYMIVYDLPVLYSRAAALLGDPEPYRWAPGHGARLGLLPRDGDPSQARWFDIEPCYVFHPLNAYERVDSGGRGQVVIEVVRHPRAFDRNRPGWAAPPPTLWRWTVDLGTGWVREEQLSDEPEELPQVDPRTAGRAHRYGYGIGLRCARGLLRGPGSGAAVLKHDLRTGTVQRHAVGVGRGIGEAVFVPRPGSESEDDGWLLAAVDDAVRGVSEVVVLDAAEVAAGPVATVHLPVRLPAAPHAYWRPAG